MFGNIISFLSTLSLFGSGSAPDPLLQFLKLHDAIVFGCVDWSCYEIQISNADSCAIRELHYRLIKSPLTMSKSNINLLRNSSPEIIIADVSYARVKELLDKFDGFTSDKITTYPISSSPITRGTPLHNSIVLQKWSADTHTGLPSPEEVGSAIVLSKEGSVTVAKVNDTCVVKYGRYLEIQEAAAMLFVSEHTNIPIARVHGVYQYNSDVYIFMDFIPGRTLAEAWPDMTSDSKAVLIEQLRICFEELHAISGTYVGGVGGAPCTDCMFKRGSFSNQRLNRGPFPSVSTFHDALMQTYRNLRETTSFPLHMFRAYRRKLNDDYPIVFSHGDIARRNIMVTDDGKLAAIIDWQFAGFWPAYWDWVKAWYGILDMPVDWGESLDQFLQPYDAEVLVDAIFRDVLV